MIEVLFSIGLIAFVLLSLLSYQICAEKNSYRHFLKTIATIQLSNFSEMLLTATSDGKRQALLSQWNDDNQQLLPQGLGRFSQDNSHDCHITIQWFSGSRETESIAAFC